MNTATTTNSTMGATLKSTLAALDISPTDQVKLATQHGIVDYKSLKEKQYQLDRKQLADIDSKVQTIVSAALFYADTLQTTYGYKDPLAHFTRLGWMDYAVSMGRHASARSEEDRAGGEGGSGDGEDPPLTKLQLEPDADDSNPKTTTTANAGGSTGEDMEVDHDVEDDDPFKASLARKNRKKSKLASKEHVDELEEKEPEKQTKFGMMPQGVVRGSSDLLVDLGEFGTNNQKEVKILERVYDAKGRCFQKAKCYHYTDEDTKETFIVGIKSFVSERTAVCVKVQHISETYLGIDDKDKSFETAVQVHYPTLYCQIDPPLRVPVAKMGDKSNEPQDLPKLIYEPRRKGDQMSFAYVRDNDYHSIVRLPRNDIRMIEGFSGAGGMHIGYSQEGFTTVRAVEWCPKAVKTFEHNNPGVPTYCGDILEFIKTIEENEGARKALGRIDVVHVSSPCQGFSLLNPGTVDPEVDRKRNELSYTLPTLLKLTGALVGVLENVMGMWVKGQAYLRKILIDCIAMGYQVRVKVIQANNYGDPQVRPRLIIIAAKNFCQMPKHPVPTHGEARHLKPYVKVADVLEYLRTPAAQNLPNIDQNPSQQKNPIQLYKHNFAPAMLASKTALRHYAEDRLITAREAATLQSFPLDYQFLGTVKDQFKQIGNAVPIEMSRAIARSVRESLCYRYVEEQEAEAAQSESTTNDGGMEEDATLDETTVTV